MQVEKIDNFFTMCYDIHTSVIEMEIAAVANEYCAVGVAYEAKVSGNDDNVFQIIFKRTPVNFVILFRNFTCK